jgi:hypothetical protein
MQNWDSDRPLGMKWTSFTLKKSCLRARLLVIGVMATTALLAAQAAVPAPAPAQSSPAASDSYQSKFPGDPARSNSEAGALGYMRTVLRAQREFNKKNGHFATSLAELVHTGSFTKRMVNTDRGDYSVGFEGKKDSFALTMTPKQLDGQHRSFYAEDDGKIHADEEKAADAKSPVVK